MSGVCHPDTVACCVLEYDKTMVSIGLYSLVVAMFIRVAIGGSCKEIVDCWKGTELCYPALSAK